MIICRKLIRFLAQPPRLFQMIRAISGANATAVAKLGITLSKNGHTGAHSYNNGL